MAGDYPTSPHPCGFRAAGRSFGEGRWIVCRMAVRCGIWPVGVLGGTPNGLRRFHIDVNVDESFATHRDIAAASGFRAVRSTPLADRAGRLFGMVSTHYPRPHSPSERGLQLMRRYGEVVGQAMSERLSPRPNYRGGRPLTPAVEGTSVV
jgi:hypothetical protein